MNVTAYMIFRYIILKLQFHKLRTELNQANTYPTVNAPLAKPPKIPIGDIKRDIK